MARLVSQFIERARTAARAIKTEAEASGEKISLSRAYERFAKANGYRTWNAMRASMESVEQIIDTVIPVTTPNMHWIFPMGPVEKWAFTTQSDDVTLRKMIYDDLGPEAARFGLAKMFPLGTASTEIERRLNASNSDDGKTGVLRRIADDVTRFVRDALVLDQLGGETLVPS